MHCIGCFGRFVLMAALATRGSAQACTQSQEGCATHATRCSQFASPARACTVAADGYFVFLNDLVQPCAEVEGAASNGVTCVEADNSRAVCRSLAYHHTDNTVRGVSDTCTLCLEQPLGCAESPTACMSGTCTGSHENCGNAAATCSGEGCDWTAGTDEPHLEGDCPDGCTYASHASVCEGVGGCTYTPPSYRQCRAAAPGYYTDANYRALGAWPSCPIAARSHFCAYTPGRTLRSMRGGGKCRSGHMLGRGQQPRRMPPWLLQQG